MLGDHETGRRHGEKGLEMVRETGVELWLSPNHLYLGLIHLELGDLNKARSLMEEALKLSQENNEKLVEAYTWIGLGSILGKTEPPQIDQAEANILKGIEICRKLKVKAQYSLGYLYLGELYLNVGEQEKAKDNLKKAEGMFQDMGMDYWLGRTYAVYTELYIKEGDKSKAKENLNKAVKILKECGADGWVEKYEKELAEF
jgi:tetratricopeptide (TPR) repeat protein